MAHTEILLFSIIKNNSNKSKFIAKNVDRSTKLNLYRRVHCTASYLQYRVSFLYYSVGELSSVELCNDVLWESSTVDEFKSSASANVLGNSLPCKTKTKLEDNILDPFFLMLKISAPNF